MILQQSNDEILNELADILQDFDYTQVILTESQQSKIKTIFLSKFSKLIPTMISNFEELPEKILDKGSDAYIYLMSRLDKFKKRLAPKVASDRARLLQLTKTNSIINENTEETSKQLSNTIANYFKEAISEIKITINDIRSKEKTDFTSALINLIIFTAISCFIMSVIGTILFSVVGMPLAVANGVALIVSSIAVIPIIEEYSKKQAIENGYASEYIIVFNTLEFIFHSTKASASIGTAIMRIIPFLMHFTMMSIQKGNFNNKQSKFTIGINRKVDNENLTSAIKFHMVYNTIAIALEFGINNFLNAATKA